MPSTRSSSSNGGTGFCAVPDSTADRLEACVMRNECKEDPSASAREHHPSDELLRTRREKDASSWSSSTTVLRIGIYLFTRTTFTMMIRRAENRAFSSLVTLMFVQEDKKGYSVNARQVMKNSVDVIHFGNARPFQGSSFC